MADSPERCPPFQFETFTWLTCYITDQTTDKQVSEQQTADVLNREGGLTQCGVKCVSFSRTLYCCLFITVENVQKGVANAKYA